MTSIFPNYIIDLDKGTVFHTKKNGELFQHGKNTNKDGYHTCEIYDIYGNKYNKIHQVIIAEGLSLPKHMWPCEENGRRYIPDHIIPVSNGGTDSFSNLRLIPLPDNPKNENSKKNYSSASLGRTMSDASREKMREAWIGRVISDEWKEHLSESRKRAWAEGRFKVSQAFLDASKKRSEDQSIPVDMISTIDGEVLHTYPSYSQAAKQTGYNKERIRTHCYDGKVYKDHLWRRHLT